MAVTESFETWPREGWSSWLNEPIVPSGHDITQINLIERVTVTRPGESVEETHQERLHSSSEEERRKRQRRHRRSSSEGKDRSYNRHSTGRMRDFDPSAERRESRRRSQERITTHTSSAHSNGIGHADESHKRRHRSSSGDRNKPLPPLPTHGDRHTTGRIMSDRHQTSSEEWHKSRSLPGKRPTSTVGTSMHGQIFLQDGTAAPDFDMSKKSDTLDVNDNGTRKSGQDTFTFASMHETHNGDIFEQEKKPLDSRRSSEGSDIFKPSPGCTAVPSSLIYAIAVTLACFWCFPVGVYAIHRALQVRPRRKAGDIAGAMKASKSAGFWATITLIWGALLVGAVILLLVLFANP
ncbi:uncharacterized protein [Amphiura filiformis]|uniref:uncharacterized protein n=1 Tax=Amphiura filiformis TaxID=82378 RepID=UPI003B219C26